MVMMAAIASSTTGVAATAEAAEHHHHHHDPPPPSMLHDHSSDTVIPRRSRQTKKGSFSVGKSTAGGGGNVQALAAKFKTQLSDFKSIGFDIGGAFKVLFQTRIADITKTNVVEALETVLEDDGLCYTGSAEFVINECGNDCCVGEDACDWEGEATVCVGACKGDNACDDIASGSVIYPNSCVGDNACVTLGGGSGASAEGRSIQIGFEACVGEDACESLGPEAATIEIGHGACVGSTVACSELGSNVEESIVIGDYACRNAAVGNGESCSKMNAAVSVKIGRESCTEYAACDFIGNGIPKSVLIGEYSCKGFTSCVQLGDDTTGDANTITIGDGSCIGERSCQFIADDSEDITVDIGSGACVGFESCFSVGGGDERTGLVTIGDKACLGIKICSGFGELLEGGGTVSIAPNACTDVINDICSPETRVGAACSAEDCDAGDDFKMPTNEKPCSELCG